MAVRQVLYVSSGVKKFTDAEIDEILEKARLNNTDSGVTGVLFYLEGNFLQLLEGEEAVLAETYARIKSDSRHRGLTQLISETVDERSFPDWKMGFRAITASEMRDYPELFHLVEGKWLVRDGAGVNLRVKIILETFLKVNDQRSY
jgi:hypothetical protein